MILLQWISTDDATSQRSVVVAGYVALGDTRRDQLTGASARLDAV